MTFAGTFTQFGVIFGGQQCRNYKFLTTTNTDDVFIRFIGKQELISGKVNTNQKKQSLHLITAHRYFDEQKDKSKEIPLTNFDRHQDHMDANRFVPPSQQAT